MARRRRSRKQSQTGTVRARSQTPIANLWLPRRPVPLPRSSRALLHVEDRRLFEPGVRPFRTLRSRARLVVAPRPRAKPSVAKRSDAPRRHSAFFSGVPARIAFKAPERVLVCIRRQRRKEVLHAKGKAGKVGQRKPRRSAASSISCRR